MKTKFTTFISIVFLLVSSSFFISSCEKDEIDSSIQSVDISQNSEQQVSKRTQTLDIIFYRGSLTTDNYLVSSNRVYQIYNKSKVREVRFNASGQSSINVGGVLMRHYNIQIIYTDLTTRQFTAFSKSSSTSFTFTPTGTNLLSDSHTSKFLELSQIAGGNGYVYHLWRDTQIAPKTWDIKRDGVTLIATKVLDPIDKNSNIFSPPHIH